LKRNFEEMKGDVYLKEILREVPRLISQLNRNPISEDYGCFDRNYWHYNIIDFPCARMQEAALTLALLYEIRHRDNPYYNKKIILEWINSALEYWLKIQNRNGSFNEWYPNENSFVATAFSSYAISETLLQLKDLINSRDDIISGLIKAGRFISRKKESRVVNQETGAAIALYNIYLLTDDEFFKEKSFEKIEFIINEQTEEGWFNEYGGADMGYLSLAIDYLAKIYKKTNEERILNSLKKALGFIKYFIHPDGSCGGIYGSRNTEYLIPDGFEILSEKIKDAALISNEIRNSLERNSMIGLSKLDDRYLMYNGYTFLQAYLNSKEVKATEKLPYKNEFIKNFPKAGLLVISDPLIYMVVNYRKGGVYKLSFKKINRSISDAGLLIHTKKGTKLTSSWLSDADNIEFIDNKIKIKGTLWKVTDKTLSPIENILLRAFQLGFGRSQFISQNLKEKLRDILITKTTDTRYKFTREISIGKKYVKISDVIDKICGKAYINCKTSLIYTPSSRYFLLEELNSSQECIRLRGEKRTKVERVLDKKSGNQVKTNLS